MIQITNTKVEGFDVAIRGMRNPLNSWDKIDSKYIDGNYVIGSNDKSLMIKLANSGAPSHSKFKRMIFVFADISAPLYWWKEYDTYKVGTVANSCSTMHKISYKYFELSDFSTEHLTDKSIDILQNTIDRLNAARSEFVIGKNKKDWWQMIQLLPSSYNQKRTVVLNYEVLTNIYRDRKNHKLDEWRDLCAWIETLPESYLIVGVTDEKNV